MNSKGVQELKSASGIDFLFAGVSKVTLWLKKISLLLTYHVSDKRHLLLFIGETCLTSVPHGMYFLCILYMCYKDSHEFQCISKAWT